MGSGKLISHLLPIVHLGLCWPGRLSASTSSPDLPAPELSIYWRSEDTAVLVCRAPQGQQGVLFMLYRRYDDKVRVSARVPSLTAMLTLDLSLSCFFFFSFLSGGLPGGRRGGLLLRERFPSRLRPPGALLLPLQERRGALQCLQSLFAAGAAKRCM